MPMSEVPRWTWGDDPAVVRQCLDDGGVLAIPSESSYGLAVDPRSSEGVESIYRLKERERGKPLPVVAANVEQLADLTIDLAWLPLRALQSCWPAALAIVAPTARSWPAAAGGATLAVRIPAHPRLCSLLTQIGSPLTATSANRSGEPAILEPHELPPLLSGARALIIDDGPLPGGSPSTLVQWSDHGWQVLRAGRFPESELPSPSRISIDR